MLLPVLDIAKASFRILRQDAEGDHSPLEGALKTGTNCSLKSWNVLDHMVCRHHQHHRICAITASMQRSQCQRGRGVASCWLQDDRYRPPFRFSPLTRSQEAVLFVAYQGGRRRQSDALFPTLQTHGCLLQHGLWARQTEKLLGMAFTRQGKQARARAAAQNDGEQLDRHTERCSLEVDGSAATLWASMSACSSASRWFSRRTSLSMRVFTMSECSAFTRSTIHASKSSKAGG